MNEYKQVKVSVPIDIAVEFKEACITSNVSMAFKLSEFMSDYARAEKKNKNPLDYTTKRQRRKAIQSIVKQLEEIQAYEERYRDNIPENLQGSVNFNNAEQFISTLDEAIEILDSM